MINHNKHLDNIIRIKPEPQSGLRLDKSERLIPIPNYLWSNFKQSLTQDDFLLYPDSKNLINKLAKFHKVEPENICLNFGSDSSIKTIFEAFCKPGGNVITSNPCFPMYEVYAKEFQCELKKIEYFLSKKTNDLKFSLHNILENIDNETNLIVLANPNSPIGDYVELDPLLYKSQNYFSEISIIIDEAYIEFSNKFSWAEFINSFTNLIITKTFSKALGGAGIRLGYTIANKKVIQILEKLKPTFEITGPSLKYAEFILDNYDEIVTPYIESVKEEQSILSYLLRANEYEVINSNCNWIHLRKGDNLDTIKTLNTFNISFKSGLSIPHKGENWIRLSIMPGFHRSEAVKELLQIK